MPDAMLALRPYMKFLVAALGAVASAGAGVWVDNRVWMFVVAVVTALGVYATANTPGSVNVE